MVKLSLLKKQTSALVLPFSAGLAFFALGPFYKITRQLIRNPLLVYNYHMLKNYEQKRVHQNI